MWLFSAFAALLFAAGMLSIGHRLREARQPRRTDRSPQRVAQQPQFLWLAQTALGLGIALAIAAPLLEQRPQQLGNSFVLTFALLFALSALALAAFTLTMLATRRPRRSVVVEVLAWGLLVVAVGVGTCCGIFAGSAL